jgi:hypothetical protein
VTARYEVIAARREHVEAIARAVRQADCNECWAAGAVTVRTALDLSLDGAALARTWLVDGAPAALGGITGGTEAATIWLITTDLVDRNRRAFLQHSLAEFAAVKDRYELLYNFVDARNRRAIAWLKWLGFTVDPPKPYGPFGKPFYFFYWRQPQASQGDLNHDRLSA